MGHTDNFRAGLSSVAEEVGQIADELGEQTESLQRNSCSAPDGAANEMRALATRTHRQTQRMVGIRRRIEKLTSDL